jgi:hypothetical protein
MLAVLYGKWLGPFSMRWRRMGLGRQENPGATRTTAYEWKLSARLLAPEFND